MNLAPLVSAVNSLVGDMLPGAALRVCARGKSVFEYHIGCSDEENGMELNGDEIYSAYSMTKPLTAACALKAVEAGLIDLNTPIRLFLPEFEHMRVLHIDRSGGQTIKDAQGEITLRHLLTMSAGFGDDMSQLGSGSTGEAIKRLSELPLYFEPGTRWLYGLSYEVLGALLEKIYGLRLREIFKKLIFAPCGMKDSCFLSEINDYSLLAPIYRAQGQSYESAPLDLTYAPSKEYDSAGAGLVCSIRDYERFLIALTGGLISEKSLDLLTNDSLNETSRPDFNWPQMRGYGYGLGVRVPLKNGTYSDFGWGGAAGAYWLYDRHKDAGLCFFTNVLGANEAILHPLLRDAFYNCSV